MNDPRTSVLVLTSAVNVSAPNTFIIEKNQRVRRVTLAVKMFQNVYPTMRIVVCDGSGYDFGPDLGANPNLEVLSFNYDANEVILRGKGFGEGEILRYAILHSIFVGTAESVVKLTGGLFVSNLAACVKDSQDIQFYPKTIGKIPFFGFRIHQIDTRLLLFSKSAYWSYLSEIHLQVRDRDNYFLEDAYFDAFLSKDLFDKKNIIRRAPKFQGISGSTGYEYGKNRFEFARSIIQNLKIFVIKSLLQIRTLA
jgi:hypothetical protein